MNGHQAMEPLVIGANDPGGSACNTYGFSMDTDNKGTEGSPESVIAVGGKTRSLSILSDIG